jgi:hypothetical protein
MRVAPQLVTLMEKSSPLLSSCTPTVFLSAAAAQARRHGKAQGENSWPPAQARSSSCHLALAGVFTFWRSREEFTTTLLLAKTAKISSRRSPSWFVIPLATAILSGA